MINIFNKVINKINQSVKQFWIQIKPVILLGLIWV